MKLLASISNMRLICFFLLYGWNLSGATTCPTSTKFYIDCSINRTIYDSIQLCKTYQMSLLQLTNSSLSSDDILLLNNTMKSVNCNDNFCFLSNNNTVLIGNTKNLNSGFFWFFYGNQYFSMFIWQLSNNNNSNSCLCDYCIYSFNTNYDKPKCTTETQSDSRSFLQNK
jgi:hypothetical protein